MPRAYKRINFPKLVTVLAVTFGVALGACGLTALVSKNDVNYPSLLGIVELAVMVLAAVGLVLSVILWVISAAIGNR